MEAQIFTVASVLATMVVLIVQQLFKWKAVPLNFANKYPVPTNIALSVIVTIGAFLFKFQGLHWTNWQDFATTAGTIALGAALAYNQLLSHWDALKASEGVKV